MVGILFFFFPLHNAGTRFLALYNWVLKAATEINARMGQNLSHIHNLRIVISRFARYNTTSRDNCAVALITLARYDTVRRSLCSVDGVESSIDGTRSVSSPLSHNV